MSEFNGSATGVARTAQDLLAEMTRAQAEVQRLEQQRTAASTSFGEVLQQKHIKTQRARIHHVGGTKSASIGSDSGARHATQGQAGSPTDPEGSTRQNAASRVVGFLQDAIKRQDQMTDVMKLSLGGHNIDPYSLVDLQAAVYKYSQELGMTTKVVERTTSEIGQSFNIRV